MSDKDFIHEVNEDVRTDKMLNLWRQYSRYFYAFIVTILVVVGGTSLLNNYRLKQSMNLSNQYAAALELLVNRKYEGGLKALETIEQEATSRTIGYAVMAKLQRASFLLSQQKENERIMNLKKVFFYYTGTNSIDKTIDLVKTEFKKGESIYIKKAEVKVYSLIKKDENIGKNR